MQDVVQKLRYDGAYEISVMPHWTNQPWYQPAHDMATKKYYYKPGTNLFEQADGAVAGVRWPVWVLLIDGTANGGDGNVTNHFLLKSRSARRRQRRKYKTTVLIE